MGERMAAVLEAGEEWILEKRGRTARREWTEAGYPLPEQEQIGRYAEAFFGLARLFREMPGQKAELGDRDLEEVFAQIRACACRDCVKRKACWEEDYFQSCRALYGLVRLLEEEGEISCEGRDELAFFCVRPEQVVRLLGESYGRARENLMWQNRMMEQRMAAGEQIYQTAELLQKAAEGFVGRPDSERALRRKLDKEFRYLGIELGALRIFFFREGRMEIFLSLRKRKAICVSVKTIAEILSDVCGEKMRPAWNCCAVISEIYQNFHFVPELRYQMLCGISRITKAGELVSGDNYAFLHKDTGQVVMSLADGMGSGVRACQESEKVIELLEQFLEAGFPQETAVRMINSCMLLQNGEQTFSTIDLCMVDLYTARCDMLKSGAAATFLKHGDTIEVIHSAAMPTGILQQADYESLHRQLSASDTIVMMTDGVLEALPEEGREERMSELIRKTFSENAREHAQRLMERVYLMQKLHARDDMTVLVGSIWKAGAV